MSYRGPELTSARRAGLGLTNTVTTNRTSGRGRDSGRLAPRQFRYLTNGGQSKGIG